MALDEHSKLELSMYISRHVMPISQMEDSDLFAFIDDEAARHLVLTEIYSTRINYKFFEGIQAENDLLKAEAKLQIISYLSCIEIACDYLLINFFKDFEAVQSLIEKASLKKIKLRKDLADKVAHSIDTVPENLVFSYKVDLDKLDTTAALKKASFDDKLRCITEVLCAIDQAHNDKNLKRKLEKREKIREGIIRPIRDLIYFRNNVHLGHEMQSDRDLNLTHPKKAFKSLNKFSAMINEYVQIM